LAGLKPGVGYGEGAGIAVAVDTLTVVPFSTASVDTATCPIDRGAAAPGSVTNSSNGEGIFKPLLDGLLGPTQFPFEWEQYTPYSELSPLPKLKEHKRVTLTPAQLDKFVGRYGLSPQVVLTVTAGKDRLFIQENDEPKQEYLAESDHDFYSTASSDEVTFATAEGNAAQVMILHLDGKDIALKRLQ